MKKRRKITAAVLTVFLMLSAFMMTSCKEATERQSLEQIKDAGVLTVYTNAEFPPFEYMSDNTPVGVDMQIAQAIADEIGVKLEIKNVKFDTILSSVNSGKGSMGIAGISVTEERAQEVDFSINYATSKQYIILPQDSEVTKIEDLAGMAYPAVPDSDMDRPPRQLQDASNLGDEAQVLDGGQDPDASG